MHRLCLVRHAKAEQTGGIPDDDRDLTQSGIRDAGDLGKVLANLAPGITLIVASPILRARRTAAILADRTGARLALDDRLSTRSGADDALRAIAEHLPIAQPGRLVAIGHNPTFSELARRLTMSGQQGMRACECVELEFNDDQFPGIASVSRTIYSPIE